MPEPHPKHVERIRKMKQRHAVRAWEFRQRRGSKGVWDRLRAVLARSAHAYVLDDRTEASLRGEGLEAHSVGRELQPTRLYYLLAASEAPKVSHLPEIRVGLEATFLDAPRVALVYFEGLSVPRRPGDAGPASRS